MMAALRERSKELVGLAENRIERESFKELPDGSVFLAVVVIETLEDQTLVPQRLEAAIDAARICNNVHLAGLGNVHKDDGLGGRQIFLQLSEARKDELIEVTGEKEVPGGSQN